MLICFVLCAAAVLPTAFSEKSEGPNLQQVVDRNNEIINKLAETLSAVRSHPQTQKGANYLPRGQLVFTRNTRNGRDFDTLLGRSFGTNKRDFIGKRNFDEIDNAGFKDYLYKRNFDEIDDAGFRDTLRKRNFDEIDNAGFEDYLHKRNFDEIDNAGFKDYLMKRNFDEIDSAGFKDYLYKRNPQDSDVSDIRRVIWRICGMEKCRHTFPNMFQRITQNKRNFDEIDNAGFRDYLYKKSSPTADGSGVRVMA